MIPVGIAPWIRIGGKGEAGPRGQVSVRCAALSSRSECGFGDVFRVAIVSRASRSVSSPRSPRPFGWAKRLFPSPGSRARSKSSPSSDPS
jgi:hypothetical protein